MKDRTKPPVLTQDMVRTLSELDAFINYTEDTRKSVQVITLDASQSRAIRQDLKRYNSPQKNNCGKITYPLGMPTYRGYMLRVYTPPPNLPPEQASL